MKHFNHRIITLLWCLLLTFGIAKGESSDSLIVEYLTTTWQTNFSDNNRVVIFKNGSEKFDDLFKAIEQAQHSIHLEYFNFRNDSISALLFDRLKQKAKEGVEVRVIYDGFGNASNDKPLRKKHRQELRESGIELFEFDPMRFPWLTNALHRDHRKIVVIDGLIAYTGGMNVADYYLVGKPDIGEWRDLHLRVEGDIVADLQGVFIDFWNYVSKQNLHGESYYPGCRDAANYFVDLKRDTTLTSGKKCVGMTDRDFKQTPRIIHDTFIKCIATAKYQIQIVNPYITLCPHVYDALSDAAHRGVDVQIMISEKCDITITPDIIDYHVARLLKKGIKVFEYSGGFHHSKIMMIDSCCAYVGSANLNGRSMSFDYECNLFIADKHTTQELQQLFETDKELHCRQLSLNDIKSTPLRKRIKQWLLHFLIPLV